MPNPYTRYTHTHTHTLSLSLTHTQGHASSRARQAAHPLPQLINNRPQPVVAQVLGREIEKRWIDTTIGSQS